ncbi:hypothetical protein IKE97_01055 [Candidatus Saccharibacteria bacterium]|nr:hypothetical protein [Candidatus Saccharibacteria bacterium]
MAENIKDSKQSKQKSFSDEFIGLYWTAVLAIVDAAGKYAAAIKLRANYLDPSTEHMVKDVVDRYYNGRLQNINDEIDLRQKSFDAKVEKFNILCSQAGMTSVTKPARLLNLLLDEKRRVSYRGKARRRMKSGKICRLQDFEK